MVKIKKINRTGETNINYQGIKMKIITYNLYSDITVEFEDGYIVKSAYKEFKKGNIKNPNIPSVYKMGYLGVGKYSTKDKDIYIIWNGMLRRCYDLEFQIKHPTYRNCIVCDEWLNFQNFAKWYEENKWSDICKELDKDILVKGNKIYSPDTCILVDKQLNTIFLKCDKSRGQYPVGVFYHKKVKKYITSCQTNEKRIHIGCFNTPNEAFNAYKNFKEDYVKNIANMYKEKYENFPQKLYNAMYRFEVEIDD